MKKLILGSAIVAVLGVASNAMAAPNTGTVNFIGTVSSATCEIAIKDSAGANLTNVNLGVLASSSADDGAEVQFKLVPQDQACLEKTGANVSWSASTLGDNGIGNTANGGTNAWLRLAATNAAETGDDAVVKLGHTSFNYTVAAGIQSFDYSAKLMRPTNGNMTAGQFAASATYVVTYS
ncbi:fimbrial protein [Citrobacter amalonaticus]|uniref:fimbrial protein n=1 Tax=Citrobacter amalonaticus TaxID=35703 RepID=UPI001787F9F6|nr:fimbrial protein [Citrobacter amalonaticus]MBE0398010.1 fimbrial protein [Citrobacter amalonaticus]